MLDYLKLEKRAMYRRVTQLAGRYRGRCHAMGLVAKEFNCSYEKVRRAVYEIEKQKSNLTTMNSTIKINNETEVATIDIEGTIGLTESWQFDNPESRVTTYEHFKECVARIADLRNAHIRVNIRSTGGDVNDAMLIYEALRATGAEVTTCCYGYTASAATIVAQAASAGRRLVAPTSLYLVHNSLCTVEGNADEIAAEVELLRQTDERIAEIYARHSGRDKQDMAAKLMKEACKKYKNVYFIDCTDAADALQETSVDGTHPGDYGYSLWAKSIEKPLLKILKKYGIR
jgi:ATP-dependent protease ClpP protease subunit